MIWHDWATLASIFMAGLFDGNGTVLRDAIPSKWEVWFKNNTNFLDWRYGVGGNKTYNPSNPFTADMWHFNKFLLIYSYCAAVAFQAWARYGWKIGVASFLLLQALEGTTFRWFYGYAFRQTPVGTFWTFIKSSVPWNGRDNSNE